jgi:hypothetical protein
MGEQIAAIRRIARNRYVGVTLRLIFCMLVLTAAYTAGAISGSLLLRRLSNEADFERKRVELLRPITNEVQISARLSLIGALQRAKLARIMYNARIRERLPRDRFDALRDRLQQGVSEREARRIRAPP